MTDAPVPSLDELERVLALQAGPRIDPLLALGRRAVSAAVGDVLRHRLVEALLELVHGYAGNNKQRLAMGEIIGQLGDPRICTPDQPNYWASAPLRDGGVLSVGRFPVTVAEFRAWVAAGGYDSEAWSEAGRAWLAQESLRWNTLADNPDSAALVVANQPVVGVTWWEAEAYARAHGARLLSANEHRGVTRGLEKRPYPWGAPFGDGNANTKEEALGRPCAVGLFGADATPEGVVDLAGNAGCWLADVTEDGRRMLHPGAWSRPSMAAWAKALEMSTPDTRSADLGFRLARDS